MYTKWERNVNTRRNLLGNVVSHGLQGKPQANCADISLFLIFLYYLTLFISFQLAGFGKGTEEDRVKWEFVMKCMFKLPPRKIMEALLEARYTLRHVRWGITVGFYQMFSTIPGGLQCCTGEFITSLGFKEESEINYSHQRSRPQSIYKRSGHHFLWCFAWKMEGVRRHVDLPGNNRLSLFRRFSNYDTLARCHTCVRHWTGRSERHRYIANGK